MEVGLRKPCGSSCVKYGSAVRNLDGREENRSDSAFDSLKTSWGRLLTRGVFGSGAKRA